MGRETSRRWRVGENSEIAVLHRLHQHGVAVALLGAVFPVRNPKHSATIIKVDGTPAHSIGRHPVRETYVGPGLHSIEISYKKNSTVAFGSYFFRRLSNYNTRLTIEFTAEAGHQYHVPAERRNEQDWIWVEDITTGKVVAGAKPQPEKG